MVAIGSSTDDPTVMKTNDEYNGNYVDSLESPIAPNEINHLHNEIMDHARISLAKAIEIGAALHAWKEKLGHGKWMPWFKANIKFTLKTADRYRLLYEGRSE